MPQPPGPHLPLVVAPPYLPRAMAALRRRLQDEVKAGTLAPNSVAVYESGLRRFDQRLGDGSEIAGADDFLRALDGCIRASQAGEGGLNRSLAPLLKALRGRWLAVVAAGLVA